MKIKSLLGIGLFGLMFTSCGKSHFLATDLTIPVIHAIQDNDYEDLASMLPNTDNVNAIFAGNTGNLGPNYYNKYTSSYRVLSMKTGLYTDMELIQDISKSNGLNWDDVQIGGVEKEEVSDSTTSYTKVTANLLFPKGGEYTLSYNTIQHHGIWYLLDDVSFRRREN